MPAVPAVAPPHKDRCSELCHVAWQCLGAQDSQSNFLLSNRMLNSPPRIPLYAHPTG
jgi:hypothetical protein